MFGGVPGPWRWPGPACLGVLLRPLLVLCAAPVTPRPTLGFYTILPKRDGGADDAQLYVMTMTYVNLEHILVKPYDAPCRPSCFIGTHFYEHLHALIRKFSQH